MKNILKRTTVVKRPPAPKKEKPVDTAVIDRMIHLAGVVPLSEEEEIGIELETLLALSGVKKQKSLDDVLAESAEEEPELIYPTIDENMLPSDLIGMAVSTPDHKNYAEMKGLFSNMSEANIIARIEGSAKGFMSIRGASVLLEQISIFDFLEPHQITPDIDMAMYKKWHKSIRQSKSRMSEEQWDIIWETDPLTVASYYQGSNSQRAIECYKYIQTIQPHLRRSPTQNIVSRYGNVIHDIIEDPHDAVLAYNNSNDQRIRLYLKMKFGHKIQ